MLGMRVVAMLLIACASPAPRSKVTRKPPPPPPVPTAVPAPYWGGPLPACHGDVGAPAKACARVGDRCAYNQGVCSCMDACHGGANLPDDDVAQGPAWECYPTPPPRTDGCPEILPHGECSGSLKCGYGRPNLATCFGTVVECRDGQWTEVRPEPPP
jgi:hypothetical protein